MDEPCLHEPQLRAAGLQSVTNFAGPLMMRADADRLHQAISNLLANATSYCSPGDTVTVTLTAETDHAVLGIADTEPSISASDLPPVFERLWMGGAQHIPASGIGLAVVREITRGHGGTVEATSSQGEATTLTIRLPSASPGKESPR